MAGGSFGCRQSGCCDSRAGPPGEHAQRAACHVGVVGLVRDVHQRRLSSVPFRMTTRTTIRPFPTGQQSRRTPVLTARPAVHRLAGPVQRMATAASATCRNAPASATNWLISAPWVARPAYPSRTRNRQGSVRWLGSWQLCPWLYCVASTSCTVCANCLHGQQDIVQPPDRLRPWPARPVTVGDSKRFAEPPL